MKFYRVDKKDRNSEGSLLEPGNWGTYAISPIGIQFEDKMEALRLQFGKDAVSRQNCIFSFSNINLAESLLMAKPRESQSQYCIYELEVSDEVRVSTHNYSVVSHIVRQFNSPTVLQDNGQLMIQYWLANGSDDYTSYTNLDEYVPEDLIGGKAYINKVWS